MKSFGVLLAALVALTAQTPAVPARHLEYAFSVYPTVGQGGESGILSVDFEVPQADGTLRIHASQLWTNSLRPLEGDCDLRAGGTLRCDQGVTLSESLLLPMLAQDYFQNAAPGSQWQRSVHQGGKQVYTAVVTNLTAQPSSELRTLLVDSHASSEEFGACYCFGNRHLKWTDDTKIAYDRVGKVPVDVSDVRTYEPTASNFSQVNVALQLTKDSAAQ
jgi:hypothetical protein